MRLSRLFLAVVLCASLVQAARPPRAKKKAPAQKSAIMIRVVDGDTLMAVVDGKHERVRLRDISAPEKGQPGYAKAKQDLAKRFPSGCRLKLTIYARDKYARIVAVVEREKRAPQSAKPKQAPDKSVSPARPPKVAPKKARTIPDQKLGSKPTAKWLVARKLKIEEGVGFLLITGEIKNECFNTLRSAECRVKAYDKEDRLLAVRTFVVRNIAHDESQPLSIQFRLSSSAVARWVIECPKPQWYVPQVGPTGGFYIH